jgi:single-strand DNA-binding protein
MARRRRLATRGPAARVALRAARAGLGPGFPCGFAFGAFRRFARAFVRAVDGVVPAAGQETFDMTNTVLLVGNLGADPDLRTANSGTDIASFSLGTSRPKRDSEGKTYKDASGFTAKDTEWHRITCFNGLGRIIAQHATKGMLVSVRGRLHYTRWTDREGVERYGCEIIADDVQFLSRPRHSDAGSGSELQADLDDDVPF